MGFEDIEAYLECEEGQAFAVCFRRLHHGASIPDFQIKMQIDGREVAGRAWRSIHPSTDIKRMYILENGIKRRADLQFTKMPKTESEQDVDLRGSAMSRLCRIEVQIRQGRYDASNGNACLVTASSVGKVHEKAMKFGSTIEASNCRPLKPGHSYKFTPSARDSSLCRFTWKYHTKDQLSIMGVIEDEPAQSDIPPAQGEESRDSLMKLDDNVAGVKREREVGDEDDIIEEVKRVKKEKIGPGSSKQPIMVSEVDPPRRSRRVGNKEIVDLTME